MEGSITFVSKVCGSIGSYTILFRLIEGMGHNLLQSKANIWSPLEDGAKRVCDDDEMLCQRCSGIKLKSNCRSKRSTQTTPSWGGKKKPKQLPVYPRAPGPSPQVTGGIRPPLASTHPKHPSNRLPEVGQEPQRVETSETAA